VGIAAIDATGVGARRSFETIARRRRSGFGAQQSIFIVIGTLSVGLIGVINVVVVVVVVVIGFFNCSENTFYRSAATILGFAGATFVIVTADSDRRGVKTQRQRQTTAARSTVAVAFECHVCSSSAADASAKAQGAHRKGTSHCLGARAFFDCLFERHCLCHTCACVCHIRCSAIIHIIICSARRRSNQCKCAGRSDAATGLSIHPCLSHHFPLSTVD
jgi:hypothetical protein